MKFTKSFMGATGGNPYPQDFKKGDDCPDDLLEAAKLAGVIAAGVTLDPSDIEIPDEWEKLNSPDMTALAKALGGKGIKTKADAEECIRAIEAARNPSVETQIEERDGKFVIVKGDDVIGDEHETKEAAEAALDALETE